jgi:transposase-like protein
MDAVRSSMNPLREVEVTRKAQRRRFTAEYKRKILAEAEACAGERGAVGALLRREGLYSSHLVEWRRLAERGQMQGLSAKRGPKPKAVDPRDRKIVELEHALAKQTKRLQQAEAIIEVQKKLSRLLGITLPDPPESDEETP